MSRGPSPSGFIASLSHSPGSPRALTLMISDDVNTDAFCPSRPVNAHLPSTFQTSLAYPPTLSNTSPPYFSLALSRASHASTTPNLTLITSDHPSFPTFPRFPTPSAYTPVVRTLALIVEIRLNDHSADWMIHVHTPCSSLSLDQPASSSHIASIKFHNYATLPLRASWHSSISTGALAPVEVSNHPPSTPIDKHSVRHAYSTGDSTTHLCNMNHSHPAIRVAAQTFTFNLSGTTLNLSRPKRVRPQSPKRSVDVIARYDHDH